MTKKKISINLFIHNESPFFEEVLDNINNINCNKFNIKFNIFNILSKYNKDFFENKLLNFKNKIHIHNTNETINKIIFEDIEFNINNNTKSYININNNKCTNIYLHPKIYSRLYPILEDELESNLKIITNNSEYILLPNEYTKDGFINKSCENNTTNILNNLKYLSYKLAKDFDYYFYIDNLSYIKNNNIINDLIKLNKDIIAPTLGMAGGQVQSNFSHKINNNNLEYNKFIIPILQGKLKNTWKVEYIDNCYLIKKNIVKNIIDNNVITSNLELCKYFKDNNIQIYADNLTKYGWLINTENMVKDRVHIELYQFDHNRLIWHQVYLSEVFVKYIEEDKKINYYEPKECKDIFEWQCFTEKFCKHLIDECEHFGEWSTGSNQDTRLSSGYENVPTRDIHLKQIGLGDMWLTFVNQYLAKVAGDTFSRINTKGYNIAFVVRYTMDTQKELKPHHDASTHSTVTCLNNEFEGGGTHFIRQNYTHNPKKLGLTSIHPGRCTHYHEGKPITSGKRYILISFNE